MGVEICIRCPSRVVNTASGSGQCPPNLRRLRKPVPVWAGSKHEISKDRYAELKAFCLQYSERSRMAASLLDPSSRSFNVVHDSHTISDPTYRAVEKREKLLQENELIDKCLAAVQNGIWAIALKKNVCQNIAWQYIEPEYLPTSNRNRFFDARKAFFLMLDEMR